MADAALRFKVVGDQVAISAMTAMEKKAAQVAASTAAAAEASTRQWGGASRQIAGGLEAIARQGKITGEALKQIGTQGAEMAFTFGKGGPIVGALAITGIAIYEYITGNMRKAREEINALRTDLEGMSLGDAAKKQSTLYSGNPRALRREGESNADYIARSRGLAGLDAERSRLRGRINPAELSMIENARESDLMMMKLLHTLSANGRALLEINERAAQMRREYEETAAVVQNLTSAAVAADRANVVGGAALPGISGAGGVALPSLGGLSMMKPNAASMLPLHATGIGKGMPADNPAMVAAKERYDAMAGLIGQSFAETMVESIQAGLTRLFSRGATFGNVFASVAQSASAGIGQIAIKIAKDSLMTMKWIEKLAAHIANPWIGIPVALGLLAFGTALAGAGGRGAGSSSFGGGSSYGSGMYGSAGSIIDRGIIDPTRGVSTPSARSMNNYSFTIIGANDPNAQRDIMQLIKKAESRGIL